MKIILAILLVMVGVFMIIKPKEFYEWSEGWKNTNRGEPSEFYINHTRVKGVVFLAVGIMGLVLFIFLK